VRTVVTGSIATDHLMTFPGRFTEQLIADRLATISLSFLVDHLEIRRGGVAANIAYGLGQLGRRPVLVGAVGADFADYDARLSAAGVDTASVLTVPALHTARFVCTTDADQNQIASFYPGAMSEARSIDLEQVVARTGEPDLVLVAPDDPTAMLRHTECCRRLGIPFAADPSQQLATLEREQVRSLVDGARYLFTNEYEASLLLERTGWREDQVLSRVGVWLTTMGADGVRLRREGRRPEQVRAVADAQVVDPTGVGDAFRAGFLAGVAQHRPEEQAVQLGCTLASVVLGVAGGQEYRIDAAQAQARRAEAYDQPQALLGDR
jgi:adenosine kinase